MNKSGELSAFTVVNEYDERELIKIFRTFGELPNARKITDQIMKNRASKKIKTTTQLMEILGNCAPKFKEHKFFAQVFQAIRIEVNQELEVLKSFLEQTEECIKPNGRLVVMSYHSLEDRLVKNYLKRGSIHGEITKDFFGNVLKPFNEVNRHPIVAVEEEIERNTRARSAKLRIAERNG
jgi:16S rRNA (cytosine1402-N4)-methyltransferase